jgi:hypothetical protein
VGAGFLFCKRRRKRGIVNTDMQTQVQSTKHAEQLKPPQYHHALALNNTLMGGRWFVGGGLRPGVYH